MNSPSWNANANTASSLGHKGRIVTPGTGELSPVAKSIVMLSAGDITIQPLDNAETDQLAFVGLPAGAVIPFLVRRVTACTGTCATID